VARRIAENSHPMTPVVNKALPEFEAHATGGVKVTPQSHLGHAVVLYFYPKDDTPGCTTEACSFRDGYGEYQRNGVTILGISPDSPKKNKKFKEKFALPYSLLADTNHKVCEAYEVWGSKKFMGREYDGVFRTTFLVDGEGMLRKVFENVKPDGHAQEVLAALA